MPQLLCIPLGCQWSDFRSCDHADATRVLTTKAGCKVSFDQCCCNVTKRIIVRPTCIPITSFFLTSVPLVFSAGTMQAWMLLPIMACGLLTLCSRGSPTSMGHPLPKPLQGPYTPHPSVNHTPLSGPGKGSPAASDNYDDYYEDYYDSFQTTESPRSVSPGPLTPFCAYDRCKHLQVPCVELSRLSKCLCPGVTGPDITPDAPRLRAVHVSETRASLHWCAPSSTVHMYHLKYRLPGEDFISGPPLNSTVRVTVLSDLIPGTEYVLCIVAANRAGSSLTDDGIREHGPCRHVRTPAHQMTYVYIAVGLASVVILGVVSVLLWHFYIRKAKPVQHGSLDNILDGELSSGHAGATNSLFRTEEQL